MPFFDGGMLIDGDGVFEDSVGALPEKIAEEVKKDQVAGRIDPDDAHKGRMARDAAVARGDIDWFT